MVDCSENDLSEEENENNQSEDAVRVAGHEVRNLCNEHVCESQPKGDEGKECDTEHQPPVALHPISTSAKSREGNGERRGDAECDKHESAMSYNERVIWVYADVVECLVGV